MQYKSGIVNSVVDLRTEILNFATRTLGNYADLFNGELGRSIVSGNRDTIAFQHRKSGAVYVFDFVSMFGNLVQTGGENETAIVGQLLSSAAKNLDFTTDDMNEIIAPNTAVGQIVEGPYSAANSIDFDVTDGVVTVTDTYAQGGADRQSLFLGMSQGQGLFIRDQTDADLWHVIRVERTDTRGEVAIGTQIGAVDGVGSTPSTSLSLLTTHSSTQDRIQKILFPVGTEVELVDTDFGAFAGSMWDSDVTLTDLRLGYFPRSGRHNFPVGVQYWFYGNTQEDDDYFHMVFRNNTPTSPFSHWWMGRVSGPCPALRSTTSAAGMFLGTTGPWTSYSFATDTYQYAFQFGDASIAFRNPCAMVAPIDDTNAEFESVDPTYFTGATEYSVNFSLTETDSWVAAANATVTPVPGAFEVEKDAGTSTIERTGLSINAANASTVRFCIRRTVAGDASTSGSVGFTSLSGSSSVSWSQTNLHSETDKWWTIEVDLSGEGFWTGTVTEISITMPGGGTTFGDRYEIAWVRVDDGSDAVVDSAVQVFEQLDGGINGYGPTGASHDARFGESVGGNNKTLDTSTYSVQAGLNGFNGPFTYGMDNARGRTFHALRLKNTTPVTGYLQHINRFVPCYGILYEDPLPTVRDTRGSYAIGTEAQRNVQYMTDYSFYMFVGQIPGVWRGTALSSIADGGVKSAVVSPNLTLDQIPVSKASGAGQDLHPEDVSTDSGQAIYIYKR